MNSYICLLATVCQGALFTVLKKLNIILNQNKTLINTRKINNILFKKVLGIILVTLIVSIIIELVYIL